MKNQESFAIFAEFIPVFGFRDLFASSFSIIGDLCFVEFLNEELKSWAKPQKPFGSGAGFDLVHQMKMFLAVILESQKPFGSGTGFDIIFFLEVFLKNFYHKSLSAQGRVSTCDYD